MEKSREEELRGQSKAIIEKLDKLQLDQFPNFTEYCDAIEYFDRQLADIDLRLNDPNLPEGLFSAFHVDVGRRMLLDKRQLNDGSQSVSISPDYKTTKFSCNERPQIAGNSTLNLHPQSLEFLVGLFDFDYAELGRVIYELKPHPSFEEAKRMPLDKSQPNGDDAGDIWLKILRKVKDQVVKRYIKPCIFKIPSIFRSVSVNGDAYTPSRVGIGPYYWNHTNDNLRPMQSYKVTLFKYIEGNTSNLGKFICTTLLTPLNVSLAIEHYAKVYNSDGPDVVKESLAIDGAFVAFFLGDLVGLRPPFKVASKTIIHKFTVHERKEILRDLLLLENQLPYFILELWFRFLYKNSHHSFSYIAYCAFRPLFPVGRNIFLTEADINNITCSKESPISTNKSNEDAGRIVFLFKHLLHLITLCCLPRQENICSPINKMNGEMYLKKILNDEMIDPLFSSQPFVSVTNLSLAGVEFKKKTDAMLCDKQNLVVEFDNENGVLQMPCLTLDEFSESFIRNIIAFEQYYLNSFEMTSYIYFMDHLIITSDDVHLLQQRGIIENWLNSEEKVTYLFNSITRSTFFHFDANYRKVSTDLMNYASLPLNHWKAKFRRAFLARPGSLYLSDLLLCCSV